MRAAKGVQILTSASIAGLLWASPARAEDTKGKWQFGFGLSYYSTVDYIRSNADIARAGGVVGENGLPAVDNVDDRPDINILNQPSIKDKFKLDLSASYGLTRWLALEAAVGYMQAPVGNIEFYLNDKMQQVQVSDRPSGLPLCGPTVDQKCSDVSDPSLNEDIHNTFLPVGTITEIPVHLSGLVRFRPESPFDPYIGLGVGYIQTHMSTSDQFNERSSEVTSRLITADCEGDYTVNSCPQTTDVDKNGNPLWHPGQPFKRPVPFHATPLSATVRSSFEWHAVGGVDYYINEKMSFYVDARYTWTGGAVHITTDGQPQVNLAAEDQGRLLLQNKGTPRNGPGDWTQGEDKSGYFLWEDTGFITKDNSGQPITCDNPLMPPAPGGRGNCAGDGLFETEDKNYNGVLDPLYTDDKTGLLMPEDNGMIYVLPPGPFHNVGERFDDLTFFCAACVGNGGNNTYFDSGGNTNREPLQRPDSEDKNYNGYMDRYLQYGIDICSTPDGKGNPGCAGISPSATPAYVWPGNCATIIPGIGNKVAEGCPPPQPFTSASPKTTAIDDTADIYIIQGGRIHLGGFALGVGMKFTF